MIKLFKVPDSLNSLEAKHIFEFINLSEVLRELFELQLLLRAGWSLKSFTWNFLVCVQGKIAHAVVMPSVTVQKLDDFVKELIEARKSCFPDGNVIVPCVVEDVGAQNCACSLHCGAVLTRTKDEKLGLAPSQNGVHGSLHSK